MKPEQLNRLIRSNGRMQPWFLRNTSELYDSAVRSYYGRGSSTMPYSTQIRPSGSLRVEENESPLRKLTKAEQKVADEYPRTHRLQTARIASGQRLPTVMQASQQRSMSRPCGGAHPYSVFGELEMGGDSSSSSCSSASSEPSQHRLVMDNLPRCLRKSRAAARRERKRTERRANRAIELGNGHQFDLDMGLFSARSLSVPPPTGLGMGNTTVSSLMMRQMPPCRRHHMKAIEKTTLANAVALMPRGEGNALMTVDATLKRQISVMDKGQRTSPELGPHLTTGGNGKGNGNGSLIGAIHNPPSMRFRFHGLGDRIKQFEYIQFADGPVTSYAFDRRQHRGGSNTSAVSTFKSIENSSNRGQKKQPAQLRVPSVHNVLHANHRQRSRSLEPPRADLMMPQALPPPLPTIKVTRSTRGSSLDISSRRALTARGTPVRNISGLAKPTNSRAKMASKLLVKRVETPEDKSLRAETPRFRANWQMTSRSAKASLLAKKTYENDSKEFRVSTDTRKSNLNSGALKDINGTSKDTNSRAFSTAKLQFRRSSVDGSFKGDSGAASSAAFAKQFSSYPAHNEPARATCAPVRRVQLQQRSVDSPNQNLALCLMTVKRKVKPKMKTLLEMPSKAQQLKATKMSTIQMRRSSHRAFYQSGNQEDMSARHRTHHKQQEKLVEKDTEQREQNLDRQKWSHGPRAITVPSSQLEKMNSKLSGTGQLLAKSASQVNVYKRAFRTTHPMLKAEILHRQAQNLIKVKPKSTPNWSSESSSPSNQQPIQPEDVRPIQQSRLHSRQGPFPATSRTTIRPGRNGAFATEEGTSGKGGTNGTNGFTVKAVAAPVTAPLTAAGTRTMAASTTTSTVKAAFMQKAQLTQRKPNGKGAVSGAVTATAAAEGEGGGGGGGGGGGQARSGGGRKAAGGTTKQRQATPTLAVQQQQQQHHSRYDSGNGSSLIGFRREAANRSVSTQLQRRDESEQGSQSQQQQQQQYRQHQRQHKQQHQSQRRQYQFQIPPWRPSY